MTTGEPPEPLLQPPPPPKKSTPGQPWSDLETVHLIDAYEERWYSLKRGQLRAHQWEEVAASVAARCGFVEPSKSGTQCRHKIEKLRKRYRSDRLRPSPSAWPYFDRMDRMERGPLPISVLPPVRPVDPIGDSDVSEDEDEDEEEEEEVEEEIGSNTRSINGILRERNWGFSRVSRNPMLGKRRNLEVEEEVEEEEEEEEEEVVEEVVVLKLAAVVRRFAEGVVRLEKRRMEMMREMERDRMEMEAKRAEMLIESQQCLVETIASAFSSLKKARNNQDSR